MADEGIRIGRFVTDGPAISSNMGEVYRSTDPESGEVVAIKVLGSGGRIERFEREVEIATSLRHPNVAGYVDHGVTSDNRPFLVTEWVSGDTLLDVLSDRGVTLREAVAIARGIAAALAEAHAHGIVHRDLKPSNVMIAGAGCESDNVVVIDFGLASVASSSALTRAGTVLGTVGYMAPEQALAKPNVGAPADVFALGCLLYVCVAGAHAFEGADENATQAKIIYHWPASLALRNTKVPPELDELIASFLAKEPGDRPPTAAAALAALELLSKAVELDDQERITLGGSSAEWETRSLGRRPSVPNAAVLVIGPSERCAGEESRDRLRELTGTDELRVLASGGLAIEVEASKASEAASAIRTAFPELEVSVANINPYERTWGPPETTWVAPTKLPDKTDGRYEQLEEIGVGGLGRVYRARDTHLERDVAIKELLHRSAVTVARFRREALVTARLEHPGIVPVQDLGRWPDGAPFYAMRLISGETLGELLDRCESFEDRLALLPKLATVAEAMAYSHENGVIHRDLKPSNVVVGEFGETVIIDWGLAKDLRSESGGDDEEAVPSPFRGQLPGDALTRAGDILGTPLYMPPEQARGKAVDERADVYSIGAMMYHLVAGRPPHTGRDDSSLETLADHEPPPLAELETGAQAELLDVIAKAMARSADDRYASAGELAGDLRRCLTGQLVGAHRYSIGEIAARFIGRHRALITVALAALAVATVVAVLSINRIIAAERRASAERDSATRARAAADLENRRLRVLQAEEALESDPTATLAWLKIDGEFPAELEARAVRAATDAVSRGVAKRVLHLDGAISSMDSAGGRLAAVSASGDVGVWDAKSGIRLIDASVSGKGGANFVALSKDGQQLVVASAEGIRYWRQFGREPADVAIPGAAIVRFTSAKHIVIATEAGELVVVDGDDATTRRKIHDGAIYHVAVRAGAIATAGHDGKVTLVLANGSVATWNAHDGIASHVEFIGDGELLSCGLDSFVRQWASGRQEPVSEWKATAPLFGMQERNGKAVVFGNSPSVGLWSRHSKSITYRDLVDTPTWAQLGADFWAAGVESTVVVEKRGGGRAELRGHAEQIDQIEVLDENHIVSADRTGELRIWELPQIAESVVSIPNVSTPPVVFDGAFAVGDSGGALWSIDGGRLHQLAQLEDKIVAVDAGKELIVAATSAGQVAVIKEGRVTPMTGNFAVHRLAIASDGAFVAALNLGGEVRLWDANSGELVETIDSREVGGYVYFDQRENLLRIAAPDGRQRRAVLGTQAPLELRDVGTTTPLPMSIAVSDDGERIAIGSRDELKLTSREGTERAEHAVGLVHMVRFAKDGTLVAVSGDGFVHIFPGSGDHHQLLGHQKWVRGLAVAGRYAVTWSEVENAAWLWSLETRDGAVLRGRAEIVGAAFASDGTRVALVDRGGFVSIYDHSGPVEAAPRSPARHQWLEDKTSAIIGASRDLASMPEKNSDSLGSYR